MKIEFPSDAWTTAYEKAINESENYKEAGKNWTHGPLGFIVTGDVSTKFNKDKAFIVDVNKGVCNSVRMANIDEAKKQPFCIIGNYSQWKAVINKQLDPIKGMMQGKLKLKGNLPLVVRYVKASQELVQAASTINTKFLDEE